MKRTLSRMLMSRSGKTSSIVVSGAYGGFAIPQEMPDEVRTMLTG